MKGYLYWIWISVASFLVNSEALILKLLPILKILVWMVSHIKRVTYLSMKFKIFRNLPIHDLAILLFINQTKTFGSFWYFRLLLINFYKLICAMWKSAVKIEYNFSLERFCNCFCNFFADEWKINIFKGLFILCIIYAHNTTNLLIIWYNLKSIWASLGLFNHIFHSDINRTF